jgi:hypothetical protein
LEENERSSLHVLPEDYDLLTTGLVDSLVFVEMLAAAGEHFAKDIDLSGLDPEKMTVVGPLCRFVSNQLRAPS